LEGFFGTEFQLLEGITIILPVVEVRKIIRFASSKENKFYHLTDTIMSYYQSKILKSDDLASLRNKVEAGLKEVGFGVLTEIDIQATMKKKLDKDYPEYLILGACNPVFADKVLTAEPHIGTLLPCNVTIRGLGDSEYEVTIMDPAAAMSAVKNPAIEPLAAEVKGKLMTMLESL
jgi:uncharacterized protein (DUF302 family)